MHVKTDPDSAMSNEDILRSWKAIADYLKCDVKTCARWAADCGLPVRRYDPDSPRSRVFACRAELDEWLANRQSPNSRAEKIQEARMARRLGVPLTVAAAVLVIGGPLAWFGLRPLIKSKPEVPVLAFFPLRALDKTPSGQFEATEINAQLNSILAFGGRVNVVQMPDGPLPDEFEDSSGHLSGLPAPDFLFQAELRPGEDAPALSVVLREARSEKALWSRIFDKPFSDASSCLREIRAETRARIPMAGEREQDSADPQASSLAPYSGGLYDRRLAKGESDDPWSLYWTAASLADKGEETANELAIEIFQRILAADPGFARAYIGLAKCYGNYVNYHGYKDVLWLDKSDLMLAKAQALDPNRPDYFATLINNLIMREFILRGDTSGQYFPLAEKALALHPYDGPLCAIVGYCYLKRFDREGRSADLDEAGRLQRIAFLANPKALKNGNYTETLMLQGEFAQALAVCLEVESSHPLPIMAFRRGEILYFQGDLAGSLIAFRSCTTPVYLKIGALLYEAMIAARRGDRTRALALLKEIDLLNPKKDALLMDHLREASIYAGLGDNGRAESLLRQGFAELGADGSYMMRAYIEIDPNFDGMRRVPLLTKVLARNLAP
jgi:tetratricopeptide (TPR) repeat protein